MALAGWDPYEFARIRHGFGGLFPARPGLPGPRQDERMPAGGVVRDDEDITVTLDLPELTRLAEARWPHR